MSVSSVLVEVVADPGAVREEVLDRDLVGDQRQVVAEQRAGGRRHREDAVLDQARDRQRRQPLDAARDRELRLQRVRNLVSSMREPVRLGEDGLSVEVDADHPGEVRLAGEGDEGQGVHARGR